VKFLDASHNCKYIFFRISIKEFVEFMKILGVVEEKLFCLLLMVWQINKEEKFAFSVAWSAEMHKPTDNTIMNMLALLA